MPGWTCVDRGVGANPPQVFGRIGRTHAGCHSGDGAVSVSALQGATRTVRSFSWRSPIRWAAGFVKSMARPGGIALGLPRLVTAIAAKFGSNCLRDRAKPHAGSGSEGSHHCCLSASLQQQGGTDRMI